MFPYLLLGIIQGLTEFLPISSSGHLILARTLLDFELVDPAYNVFVQGGTIFSLLFYFRRDLLRLSLTELRLLFLATLPATMVGLFLLPSLDSIFSNLWGVALGFSLTTVFLLFSRLASAKHQLTSSSALLIGLAQACALLPGLSRSASTITAGLLLGLPSTLAFRFSFFLSLPTVAGASFLSSRSLTWDPSLFPSYLLGFFIAALVGYFSLMLLENLLSRGRFAAFAPYTTLLAILSFFLALTSSY